jgi:hypothetical protein
MIAIGVSRIRMRSLCASWRIDRQWEACLLYLPLLTCLNGEREDLCKIWQGASQDWGARVSVWMMISG